MGLLQSRTFHITAALAALMVFTRFEHFGSAFALPDASYAIFFLAGLYLAREKGGKLILGGLIALAVLIDVYAISFRDISAWCITSAYGFLLLAYAGLWAIGNWYAPHYKFAGKNLLGLFVIAIFAGSLAFVIANVSFYLLAGYFEQMSAWEYIARVSEYFVPYVTAALMYIGMAVVVHMVYTLLRESQKKDSFYH